MVENVSGLVSQIKEVFAGAESAHNAEVYLKLVAVFNQAEKNLRETVQRVTKDEVSQIIKKLNSAKSLTNSEMDMAKLWIVGDAESYTKTENNFNDWIAEIKRVVDEIGKAGGLSAGVKEMMHLRALIMDAKRTALDIANFLEKKECVGRFEESTAELDPEERDLLAKMLKQSLTSDLD